MKKATRLLILGLVIMDLAGCAFWHSIIHSRGGGHDAKLPFYSGPKAKVAVAVFEVRTPKASNDIAVALREILIAALVKSNRFVIIEPKALNEIAQAQAKAATKTLIPESGPAALTITATVVEFEPFSSGGRAGVGGGGGAASGALGGMLGPNLSKAQITLDIRIIDMASSKLLIAKSIFGQASDISGGVMTGSLGNWSLGRGLSDYTKTPMEKAIRICIIEVIRYISSAIPGRYYKY